MNAGFKFSGWYYIDPDGSEGVLTSFSVYCDLSTGNKHAVSYYIQFSRSVVNSVDFLHTGKGKKVTLMILRKLVTTLSINSLH